MAQRTIALVGEGRGAAWSTAHANAVFDNSIAWTAASERAELELADGSRAVSREGADRRMLEFFSDLNAGTITDVQGRLRACLRRQNHGRVREGRRSLDELLTVSELRVEMHEGKRGKASF